MNAETLLSSDAGTVPGAFLVRLTPRGNWNSFELCVANKPRKIAQGGVMRDQSAMTTFSIRQNTSNPHKGRFELCAEGSQQLLQADTLAEYVFQNCRGALSACVHIRHVEMTGLGQTLTPWLLRFDQVLPTGWCTCYFRAWWHHAMHGGIPAGRFVSFRAVPICDSCWS